MRGEAFSRALQTRGVNIERDLAHLACPEEGYVGGEQTAALAGEVPEGIFCANAQLACGFLDGIDVYKRQNHDSAPQLASDTTPSAFATA